MIYMGCQVKIPHPSGLVSWIDAACLEGLPAPPCVDNITIMSFSPIHSSWNCVDREDTAQHVVLCPCLVCVLWRCLETCMYQHKC